MKIYMKQNRNKHKIITNNNIVIENKNKSKMIIMIVRYNKIK